MVHTEQSLRHLRKLALFIGIPLFIVIIIIAVFFANLTPRQSASKQISPTPNSNNNQANIQLNGINPPSSPDLPKSSSTLDADIQAETQKYKTKFENIKSTLSKYDKIFDGLKLSGQCYSSINDTPKPEQYSHATWVAELELLLRNSEIVPASFDQNNLSEVQKVSLAKFETLKSDYKDYVSAVGGFLSFDKSSYGAWVDTNQVLFKLCNSTVDQIGESCKNASDSITNYIKLITVNPGNNAKIFTALDQVNNYCKEIQTAIKNDDLAKFDQLNAGFADNYIIILSNFLDHSYEVKQIKDAETKIINNLN